MEAPATSCGQESKYPNSEPLIASASSDAEVHELLAVSSGALNDVKSQYRLLFPPPWARLEAARCRRVYSEISMIHYGSVPIDKIQADYLRFANHSQKVRFQILYAPSQPFANHLPVLLSSFSSAAFD
jgi:hypothetical protein